ncbi:cytochrome b/b6 domain-containing protein [Alteromonas halophila]|uniref:Cytochrome b561 n=1 Tax=Alteromonas halophila TaxID=516698 RepID=A0A918JJG2_9ALTE|nr:cytochrome b/b6 domain-containing protein [Alteromonas halophila]GGW82588.1 cytochrome b561 [Alteromonas halophila]
MANRGQLQIWALPVRLCHWLFVIGFTLNYFILEAGRTAHEIVGYVLVALVLFRIVWGVVKPGHAHFGQFHLNYRAVREHLHHLRKRSIPRDSGHNPIGWLFVFATLALFLVLGITGFLLEEIDALFGNPTVELIHSLAGDTLMVLACIHIAAVLFTQWRGRIALISPMITGKR